MTVKVLITGGLGYLGGRIAGAFAAEGGLALALGTRRVPSQVPAWTGNAKLVVVNALEATSLDAACAGVDCVIHLAALNEIDSASDPALALEVNGLGTLRTLEAACRHKVRRFVYFSTAHVYGAPLVGQIDETTLPRPVHPYAITHRVAEDFVLAAHRQGRIEGVVLRLSNGYGAPADPGVNRWTLIANDLCRQAVQEGRLTLNSPGLQMRDFITLGDVARAALHAVRLPGSAIGDGLFNLGGENALRVHELAERIANRSARVIGFIPPINRPASDGAESLRTLDYRIDKLKATGFTLRGDMDSELDATLRLCQQAFGSPPPLTNARPV